MAECVVCSDTNLPRQCNYCGETVCTKHRLPEKHDCEEIDNAQGLGPQVSSETVPEVGDIIQVDEGGGSNRLVAWGLRILLLLLVCVAILYFDVMLI